LQDQDIYKLILENSNDLVFILDNEDKIKYTNENSFQFLLGYSKSELIGYNIKKLFHPDNLQNFLDICKESSSKEDTSKEFRLKRKDGTYLWIEARGKQIFDKNGNLITIIIGKDITSHKRLLNMKNFSETITDKLPGIFYLIDQKGNLVRWNKNLEKMSEYSNLEISKMRPTDFFPVEYRKEVVDKIQEVFGTKDVFIDTELVTKSGKKIPYYLTGRRIFIDNVPYLMGMGINIIGRKQAEKKLRDSEERYRLITENSKDMISILDLNFKIEYINQKIHEKFLGYTKEDLINTDVTKLAHRDDFLKAIKIFKRDYNKGEGRAELRFKRKDGKYIWLELWGKIFTDIDGKEKILAISRDITKRKEISTALKSEKDRLQVLMDNLARTGIGIDIVGADYKILFQNQTLKDRFGDSIGKKCYETYRNLKEPCNNCMMIETIKYDKSMSYEITDLKGKIYQTYASPLKNPDGTVDKVMEVVIDITDRKMTENALREEKERLKYQALLLETVSDAIISTDLEFNILSWNKGAEKIYGYEADEVLGKSVAEVTRLRFINETRESVLKDFFKNGFWNGEKLHRDKNGKIMNIFSSVSLIKNTDGQPIGAVAINRDITELKKINDALQESEEKYRLITENANDIIILLNKKLEIEYINYPVSQKILGYSKEETLGKYALNLIHSEDFDNTLTSSKKAFKEGQAKTELRLRHKEGHYVWFEISGNAYLDKEGNQKLLIILRDITERKEFEEARADYMLKLEQEVEEKTNELLQKEKLASIGLLAAGIAHEINNPIMGIMNYAQIIKDEFEEEKLKIKPFSFINGILRESQRISKIVEDLLIFTRRDDSNFQYENINGLLNSTISLINPNLKKNRISVSLEFKHEIAKIKVQPQKIQQVVLNILQNSIDALNSKFGNDSKPGEKKISISTSNIKLNNKKYIQILFYDNGEGIKKENLVKIFDPFFTTKWHTKEHGTGLGLNISYNIIKSHNGEIHVQSEWKKYTLVEILLPV